MKVLAANNFHYLRGGSERVMFAEHTLLQENGHRIGCFSRSHPDNLSCEYPQYFTESANHVGLSGPSRVRHALNMIRNKEVAREFAAALVDFRPDIVHAHNIYGGLTTSILDVAREYRTPVVMTLHDYKPVSYTHLRAHET